MGELLNWYFFSPWRRLNRLHFNGALAIVTLPALLLSLFSAGSAVGSFLTPLLSLANQPSSPESLLTTLNTLNQPTTPTQPNLLIPIATNLTQLLFIPACRMRLTDMGKSPKTSLILALLFNLSYANALTTTFDLNLLPAAWLFSILSFLGFLWLCLAPSAPKVPIHERQNFPTLPR